MVEFTDEQEQEIQKRINEVKALEQWRIAGDTYYRAANAFMNVQVQQGVYDPYIMQVGQALHQSFRQANSIQHQAPQADEAANPE